MGATLTDHGQVADTGTGSKKSAPDMGTKSDVKSSTQTSESRDVKDDSSFYQGHSNKNVATIKVKKSSQAKITTSSSKKIASKMVQSNAKAGDKIASKIVQGDAKAGDKGTEKKDILAKEPSPNKNPGKPQQEVSKGPLTPANKGTSKNQEQISEPFSNKKGKLDLRSTKDTKMPETNNGPWKVERQLLEDLSDQEVARGTQRLSLTRASSQKSAITSKPQQVDDAESEVETVNLKSKKKSTELPQEKEEILSETSDDESANSNVNTINKDTAKPGLFPPRGSRTPFYYYESSDISVNFDDFSLDPEFVPADYYFLNPHPRIFPDFYDNDNGDGGNDYDWMDDRVDRQLRHDVPFRPKDDNLQEVSGEEQGLMLQKLLLLLL